MQIIDKVKNLSPSLKLAVIISVIALLWIMSGVLFSSGDDPSLQNKHHEKHVFYARTAKQSAKEYVSKIRVTGRTEPNRMAQISAEVDGRVVLTPSQEGSWVERDDILVVLDENDRKASLNEAKEALKQAEIEYEAARRLTSKQFNSEISLAKTRAALEKARAAVERAKIDLDNLVIKAPYKGILEERFVDVGDYLKVGDPVISLVDLNPIKVVGYLTENQVKNVSKGARATITLVDDRKFNGRVTFVSSAADDASRTFKVEIEAENKDQEIVAGLTASILIQGEIHKAYFVSPSILTLADDGQVGVKLVGQGDIVEFYPIKILSDQTDGMWIEGLPNSVEFITVGQEFVANGSKINRYKDKEESEQEGGE